MAKPLVTDELWEIIQPLLPPPRPRRFDHPGRKPVGDRPCLTGILFVLKTGLPWEDLPREMGCGCGMTCWRRLQEWQHAGVWIKLHAVLLARLRGADRIDWSRAAVDIRQSVQFRPFSQQLYMIAGGLTSIRNRRNRIAPVYSAAD